VNATIKGFCIKTNVFVIRNGQVPLALFNVNFSLKIKNKIFFLEEATRSDDTTTQCDDLSIRLDYLSNISPTFYLFDDDEFPRLTVNSIDGSSPGNPALWTSKKKKKNF